MIQTATRGRRLLRLLVAASVCITATIALVLVNQDEVQTRPPTLTLDRATTLVTGGAGGIYFLDHLSGTFVYQSATGWQWRNKSARLQYSSASCRLSCQQLVISPDPSPNPRKTGGAAVEVNGTLTRVTARQPRADRIELASTGSRSLVLDRDRAGAFHLLDEPLNVKEEATPLTILSGQPRSWSFASQQEGVILSSGRRNDSISAISATDTGYALDGTFQLRGRALSVCRRGDTIVVLEATGARYTSDFGQTFVELPLDSSAPQCLTGRAGYAFIERSATSKGVRTKAAFYDETLAPLADLAFNDEALISLSPCEPQILVTAYDRVSEYTAPTMTTTGVPDTAQAIYGVDGTILAVDPDGRVEIKTTPPAPRDAC